MNLKYRILLFACLLCCFLHIKAQQNNIRFQNFTLEDGISNSYVQTIYQDSEGWLWFGTSDGLNLFNGYSFVHYKHADDTENSIKGLLIRTIIEDSEKNIWIGTENGGLNKYNRKTGIFTSYIHDPHDIYSISNNSVVTITEDRSGNLWVGTNSGLNHFNKITNRFTRFLHNTNDTASISNNKIYSLLLDHTNILWVATGNGLNQYDSASGKFSRYFITDQKTGTNPLSNQIRVLYEDSENLFWTGSYLEGLNIFDRNSGAFTSIYLDDNLKSKTVRSIVESYKNEIIVGTRNGLYIYNKKNKNVTLHQYNNYEPSSLTHNSVLSLFRDQNDDIWIGTRGGISFINKNIQTFIHFKAVPNDNHYLNNREIWDIMHDSGGKLWIATENGGVNIYNPQTRTFDYLIQNNKANSINSNTVKALMEDSNGNIWIGTYLGGISVYNPENGKFKNYVNNDKDLLSISDDIIWDIFEDSENNIWIGTENGLNLYDSENETFLLYSNKIKTPQTIHFIYEDRAGRLFFCMDGGFCSVYDKSTSKTQVLELSTRVIFQDKNGFLWMGSRGRGLFKVSENLDIIKSYTTESGLAHNTVYGILAASDSVFYLSTQNGLSRFNCITENFKNFYKHDGLQSNQFNYSASCKTNNGTMLFGGNNGITVFKPFEVSTNDYIPPVVLTDIRLGNRSIQVDSTLNAQVACGKNINYIDKITVGAEHSVITFEFAALNYVSSDKNEYAYKLEGFEKEWNYAWSRRSATYTNLDPGHYIFKVKASNNDGVWNETGKTIELEILPGIQQTWWFNTLIVFLLVLIVFLVFTLTINRERLKADLVLEKENAKKIHELDMLKFKFFTNISHEIRTPLTLIISPLEKIINNRPSQEKTYEHIRIMHRNAKRLLIIVNQLLDYRKLEAGKLKLGLERGDIIVFLQDILSSFSQFAEEKQIKLKFHSVLDEIYLWFDSDKLQKVIYNLLSNALKYTHNKGTITIMVSLISYEEEDGRNLCDDTENTLKSYVRISVKDTGEGIAPDKINQIFTRFYQNDSEFSSSIYGTGIGLSLSKELVELHHGKISVKSKLNEGSEFIIQIPMQQHLPQEDNSLPAVESPVEYSPKEKTESDKYYEDNDECPSNQKLPVILIVEDNRDMLQFIRSGFDGEYDVIEANDGAEGLKKAKEHIPELIISDILMPGLSGIELCEKIKEDISTSHIPVILLTALSSKDHQKDGLLVGADAYFSKPFDPDMLKIKVNKILITRKLLKTKFSRELLLKPQDINVDSIDEKFIKKAIKIVEENISDPDFGIDAFARDIGVSRMQLYRKMSALTDMTVKEFVRHLRIKRAGQLLVCKQLNVSEIATAVGFKHIGYFRKCFKEQFGVNPTEYAKYEEH